MKNLKLSLSFLLSLAVGCASVPDTPICRQRTVNSGFCTYTVSDKDFIIDDTHPYLGKTWIDMKIEAIYVPVESWGEIKKFIIKQCKKSNKCSKDISSWDRKINSLSNK